MKISKEKAQGLAKKFLKDKDIFGKMLFQERGKTCVGPFYQRGLAPL